MLKLVPKISSTPWQKSICMGSKQALKFMVNAEVQNAIRKKLPVIALESTIITHGMPYPQNLETALEVEKLVRNHDVVPATIGILDGCIKVGLTNDELCELSQKPQETLVKCSRRDLPYVVAKKLCGGTTVAATMIIAQRAGIPIFATGGIGGVHRGGHITLDISADLIELGRTPVAVVCSGVKSILDIPRTLEYLETQGVCVATYKSENNMFPDFYTCNSGCKAPYNLENATVAAKLIQNWQNLDLKSGCLIAVPIPIEHAVSKKQIDEAIEIAHQKTKEHNVEGKAITPFLLSAISDLTQGKSLMANIALIKNNAATAAEIAMNLHKLKEQGICSSDVETQSNCIKKPLVIGASILDLSFTINSHSSDIQLNGATYKAMSKLAAGGVGRNLAEGLLKLYGEVNFMTAIGADHLGHSLKQLMPSKLQTFLITDYKKSTSLCSLIIDKQGDCKLILGNMEIHESITQQEIAAHADLFKNAPIVLIDGNLSLTAFEEILKQAKFCKVPVLYEPTDMLIAGKPFQLPVNLTKMIRIITPNFQELKTIVETITGRSITTLSTADNKLQDLLRNVKMLTKQIEKHFNCIIVTLGVNGIFLSINPLAIHKAKKLLELPKPSLNSPSHISHHYPAPLVQNIVNVTGAGDSFCAGFTSALLKGRDISGCVVSGFIAAERALQVEMAVPKTYFSDNHTFEAEYTKHLQNLKQQKI